MANQEELSVLKQGVQAWNQWYEENSSVEIDLSGADLSGVNLSGANLNEAFLSSADLSDANLVRSNLSNTFLGGADLRGANLVRSNLSNTFLGGADLRGANLTDANLTGTYLRDAIISNQTQISPKWKLVHELMNKGGEGKDLARIDLEGANLSTANLISANLSGANLSNTTLISTFLINADLRDINLNKATLRDTYLKGADLSDADLNEADLSGAHLSGAQLVRANLIYTNLSHTDLSDADLSGADLRTANLFRANLSYADLNKADLRGSILILVHAIHTNFIDTAFTGACIEDWHINSKTDFEGVKCNYIYRCYNYNKNNFADRLPVNKNKVFQDGEFENWIKVSAEAQKTIDLTFTEGIDWPAFFQSLQEVRQRYPDSGIGLQAIEKKGTAIVISLETAPNVDQGAIESTYREIYEEKLLVLEGEYKTQLAAKDKEIELYREKSADMTEIAKLLAQRPINVEAKAVAENKPAHQTTVQAQTIGNLHTGSGDIKEFTQNIGSNLNEINTLIKSLRETAQSFPEEHKDDALDELETIEANLVDSENTDPKRIGRGIKRLMLVGTAVATCAGTTATGAVDLSKQANEFTGNVLELASKLGIELVQDNQQDE